MKKMLSGFRKTQSSLRFSPAILSRRQSAGHSTFMVVIDVTALRERAHIERKKNMDLYCVQGGSKAPYCLSKAMNVQKTYTSVQNSEQCFRRSRGVFALRASRTCKARQVHHRGHRGPSGNSAVSLYAFLWRDFDDSDILLEKKAGRSGEA